MGPAGALVEISATLFMPSDTKVSCHIYSLLNNFLLEREIPRDVFIKYRNENMRKNYLDEIAQVDPNSALALA